MNAYVKAVVSLLVMNSGIIGQTFTIVATCGDHGAIAPSGSIAVPEGDSVLFRFIPDIGYKFTDVTIDGVAHPFSWSTYEFKNVDKNHSISVQFETSMICGFTPLEGRHLWKNGGDVPENTISPDQLEYRGAFRLPAGGDIPSTWSYGGLDFAYYPDGDKTGPDDGYPGSLFGIGHVYGPMCSEIGIPKPVVGKSIKELNVAKVIQPFAAIYNGKLENSQEIHGIEYFPRQGQQKTDNLYFGLGPSYLVGGKHRYANHGWCDIDLSSFEKNGLWYAGGEELSSGWTGYYLFEIPPEASKLLGGKSIATGRYRAGQGWGPHLFAIAPWDDGNPPADGAVLHYKTLLNYGEEDSMAINDCRYNDFYSGIAWATCGGKSAVLFSAYMGYRCIWYDHSMYSDSSVSGIKFYNPKDLIDVANGSKKPCAPQPYATLDITGLLFSNSYGTVVSPMGNQGELFESGLVLGGGFDRKNSLLYVCESHADEGDAPIIHVWKIADSPTQTKKSIGAHPHSFKIVQDDKNKRITIRLSANPDRYAGAMHVEVIDLKGKRIFSRLVEKKAASIPRISISTEEWANGAYVCIVRGPDFKLSSNIVFQH